MLAIVEGDDEALQDAATDIALVRWCGQRPLLLQRERGDDIRDLQRPDRELTPSRDVRARRTTDAPARDSDDALRV